MTKEEKELKVIEKTAQILADKFYDSKIFEESVRQQWLISYDDQIKHKLIELVQSKSEWWSKMIDFVFQTESQSYNTIKYLVKEYIDKLNLLDKKEE